LFLNVFIQMIFMNVSSLVFGSHKWKGASRNVARVSGRKLKIDRTSGGADGDQGAWGHWRDYKGQ
jgi:hypothetical protein